MILAILLKLVQGRILGRESGPERLLDDVHSDHILRGLKLRRRLLDTLMEDRLWHNLAALEACLVSDDKSLGQRGLYVCVVRLGCPPGIRVGLSVRSQEAKIQVDQGLDFSLRNHTLRSYAAER